MAFALAMHQAQQLLMRHGRECGPTKRATYLLRLCVAGAACGSKLALNLLLLLCRLTVNVISHLLA